MCDHYKKARFWWSIRSVWHRPDTIREMAWPSYACGFHALFYRKEDFPYSIRDVLSQAKFVYVGNPRMIWYDIKVFFTRAWYALLVIQPLHCNGNKGGWRTLLCERLEEKARFYENLGAKEES